MDTDTKIEVGWTRVAYRPLCFNLFRITLNGDVCKEDYEFGFKATHLIGNLWWVDRKSFREHIKRFEELANP